MTGSMTFAVPCCNGEPYLEALLLSLLAQTGPEFELLLVDDASDDGSVALARRVAGERIRVIENPERLGIAANWNRCVEAVQTPFFCLAHQDDVYDPEYLERMLAVLEAENEIAAVHCLAGTIDENGDKSLGPAEAYKRRFFTGGSDRSMTYANLYRGNYIACPSLLYRREHFVTSGRFDGSYRFAMDWVKNFELLLAGFELRGIGEDLMQYRRHPGSQSSDQASTLNRFEEELKVVDWARERGIEAGLLGTRARLSPAVHNNLLVAVHQALESGDKVQVRRLLEFGRASVPGFSRSVTARLVSACSKLGSAGRGILRLGLKLQ